MRVRDWQDILRDVTESDADPKGWRAVGGDRASGVGEDLYLGHPAVGLFQIKTYAKNPFAVRGVGAQVARKVDEDVGSFLPQEDGPGRFAVQSPLDDEDEAERTMKELEEVVKAHADAPTTPGDLFDDVMETIDSPAYGPMEYEMRDRPDPVDELSATFADAEEALEAEFEDIVEDDGVDRGFQ